MDKIWGIYRHRQSGRIQSGRLQRRYDPQAQGRVFTRQTPARHAQPRQVQPLHRRQG